MSVRDYVGAPWGRAMRRAWGVALLAVVVALVGMPLSSAGARLAVAAGAEDGEQVPGTLVPLFELPGEANTFVPPPAALSQPHVQTVVIKVNYSGFSAQAQAAFQHAVDIWATQLTSSVPIVVNASMTP